MILIKKRRPCVLSNISIVAISVRSPVAVNNPFSPAKWDSNNSLHFNAFETKAATNAVILGTLVMIENFLMTVLSKSYFPIFAN